MAHVLGVLIDLVVVDDVFLLPDLDAGDAADVVDREFGDVVVRDGPFDELRLDEGADLARCERHHLGFGDGYGVGHDGCLLCRHLLRDRWIKETGPPVLLTVPAHRPRCQVECSIAALRRADGDGPPDDAGAVLADVVLLDGGDGVAEEGGDTFDRLAVVVHDLRGRGP